MTAIVEIQLVEQGPAGPAGLYPQANWDAGQVPYARSTVLAHNGGVWLALRDTSVEPSVSVPSDWAAWLDLDGLVGGVAILDGTGKIPAAQLPAIAITDTYAVVSQAAMLALSAQKGDIAIRGDLNKSFVLAADDPSVLANWKELLTPTDAVLSVAGLTGAVGAVALKAALAIAPADVAGLNDAWTTYAPTLSTASGSLTGATASGRYKQIGKQVHISVLIQITTNGTGAGAIFFSLPVNAAAVAMLAGREEQTTGWMLQGMVGRGPAAGGFSDAGKCMVCRYDNLYPGANGYKLYLSGVYEAA